MQHQNRSPDNIRIEGRHENNVIIWSTEPWRFLRLLFLNHPDNRGGCVWCGNIASVVEHPNYEFYGTPTYLRFHEAGCVPMCVPCNRAKRQGKHLCPRCRRQGHYVAGSDGEVCWDCKPEEEKERLIFRKEHRNRARNQRNRSTYRRYHPKKEVRNGQWVEVRLPGRLPDKRSM
jgi:hypothetical protein